VTSTNRSIRREADNVQHYGPWTEYVTEQQVGAGHRYLVMLDESAAHALATRECGELRAKLVGVEAAAERLNADLGEAQKVSSERAREIEDLSSRTSARSGARSGRLACARSWGNRMPTIRELQVNLPWRGEGSRDFRASPETHKHFAHAILHAQKALGRLSSLVNDAEHQGCEFAAEETDRFVADLVICALRMANTCPGRVIDLERAVVARIENKNVVNLEGLK
jgi:hypothetical protein